MRGADISQPLLFITRTVEDFVPANHPLRAARKLIDEALRDLDAHFNRLYADEGRESVAPERLIRASLLQVLYTIRSERQLVEQIGYKLLYRWFVGLKREGKVWHHATFSKSRERLPDDALMSRLFGSVLKIARRRKLLSNEHFSVDGTLIDAWASHKSFRPRDDDDTPTGKERDFHGERSCNDTHASTTERDAELMRKSKGMEARLRYGVHHVAENRHHVVVAVKTEPAARVTERTAALAMLGDIPGDHRITVGGDKGYDTYDFVEQCRELKITAHVAQNTERRGGSALAGPTTGHAGYAISQRKRKLIETTFGWAKQYGGLRRMMYRGRARVSARVKFTMAVDNVLRISHLVPEPVG